MVTAQPPFESSRAVTIFLWDMNANLVLEDGTILQGDASGAKSYAVFELIFNIRITEAMFVSTLQGNSAMKQVSDYMFIDWSKNGFSQH